MGPATLVGDVGGTNCRLALAQRNSLGTIELYHSERYAVKDFKHFNDVVTEYLSHHTVNPRRAAFGFDTLIPGKVNYNKPVAVMGPGTGLGVSCILPGKPPLIIPTEGGHTAFAPQNEIEIAVLSYWLKRLGYVSVETLLSGPGLFRLYTALCEIENEPVICVREDEVVAAAEANPKSESSLRGAIRCSCDGFGELDEVLWRKLISSIIMCGVFAKTRGCARGSC